MEAILDLLKALLGELWVWTILAVLLAKFIPDELLAKLGFNIGKWITLNGNKFFKKLWTKLEEWILHSIFGVFFAEIKKGMESDN